MAKDSDSDVTIQAFPVRSGNITTVNGDKVTSYSPSDPTAPAAPTGPGYPVVMPQPPVIVVTVDRNKPAEKKPTKGYSDVFKRP